MPEFINVIGLVFQLCGGFLLAARGLTFRRVGRVWLAKSRWIITIFPGFVGSIILIFVGIIYKHLGFGSLLLWLVSLLCGCFWLPALAKYSLGFLDSPGQPQLDENVERLHLTGLGLVMVGFAIQSLAAVLS